MLGFSTGTCKHCGGGFIPAVNDEPNRNWCGGCEGGESKGSPVRKSYGYSRKSLVPEHLGTAKVCPKCSKWFAARSRQRTCDGCLPNAKKALKAAIGTGVRNHPSNGRVFAAQRVVKNGIAEVHSEYLNLTFRCPVKDPLASRLECIVSAHEAAARELWGDLA